ncbi:MAG: DUF2680 domain-containing protein [Desulfitobacterium hafniense]|nr:DUF2680 domain-containing protein [Desulfitobacterium hafniense]
MSRRIVLLAVVALLLMSALVPTAYAAVTNSQQQTTNDIYNKLAENQKQLIQQYVDAGQITQQQADTMKQRIDLMNQYQANGNATNGNIYGPGVGCWGGGPGFSGSGGWGRGWAGAWGCW